MKWVKLISGVKKFQKYMVIRKTLINSWWANVLLYSETSCIYCFFF